MDYAPPYMPPQYRPAPPPKAADPLAVALGNGSLLGVGYWLLGWRRLAVLTALISIALIAFTAAIAKPWCEILLVLWWIAGIALGWFLARRTPHRTASRTQRLIALGVTIPVLLAAGGLRYDASRIGADITAGREAGDCGKILSAQEKIWLGHRIADAPLTTNADTARETCRQLQTAADRLTTGLTADTTALSDGYDIMNAVLAEPGNDETVDTTLDGFLNALPTKDNCKTVTITDWLRQRKTSYNRLDRSADTVKQVAPEAMLGCANGLVSASQWTAAKTQYQQLLDQYGESPLAEKARAGVDKANLAIELANVRGLLDGGSADFQPEYCSKPAKYSAAPAPHKGMNLSLVYGNSDYSSKIPSGWRAKDVTQAVFVVCVGDDSNGPTVRTCPYENKTFPQFPTQVKFHKIALPVKVYEVRTGRLISSRTAQINGSSCPAILHYTTSSLLRDMGPPGDVYVTPTNAAFLSAFSSFMAR
ncbi:hypothetical protein [Kribbella sp. NPDC006257]|uniref:hypothetical protein n=1 Tax=Kribbella sp. NPDC006257 TaxID=3156738 RepID=UPI0033A8B904